MTKIKVLIGVALVAALVALGVGQTKLQEPARSPVAKTPAKSLDSRQHHWCRRRREGPHLCGSQKYRIAVHANSGNWPLFRCG